MIGWFSFLVECRLSDIEWPRGAVLLAGIEGA
jgi:hypothetical protein